MSWIFKAAARSIGKKQCMAVTGLGLSVFLVVHLAGNFLLIVGPEEFNGYARALEENPLLIPAEVVLLLGFVLHFGLAAWVTLENWRARPVRYVVKASEGTRTFASSTMWLTGSITLVFVVLHLIHFKFADHEAAGGLHNLVLTTFQSLPIVIWYVAAVCALGLHVGHGFQSAFRTLGLQHPKYTPFIQWLSRIFGVVVALGYSSLPIWAYLRRNA
ncbi:MAG TPA: succinate dehydrogenase cytochrome b subunit [Planctomycetota bacterium]|nr:succinate dehydrogenase cytochrome b subunit [Planctomycetota bacterium]